MRRILLVVLITALATTTWASPASAQTKTRTDPAGDAVARVDLRSVKAANGTANLALTARFTTVAARRTSFFTFIDSGAQDRLHVVDTYPVAGGRYAAILVRLEAESQTRLPCPGLRARADRGRRGFVRVVLPQSCLGADAGRQVLYPTAYDKQELGGDPTRRAALYGVADAGLRKGDAVEDVSIDTLRSPITLRRG